VVGQVGQRPAGGPLCDQHSRQAGGGLQPARKAAHQRGLARRQFSGAGRCLGQAGDLALQQRQHLGSVGVVGLALRGHHATAGKGLGHAAGAVAQAALNAHQLVQPGRVAAAQHRIGHQPDAAVGRALGHEGRGHGHTGLAGAGQVDQHQRPGQRLGRQQPQRGRGGGRRTPVAQQALGQRLAGFGRDVAGQHQGHLVRPHPGRLEGLQIGQLQPLHGRRRRHAAVRHVAPEAAAQRQLRHVARAAQCDAQRVQRLVAGACQLVGLQQRAAQHIGQQRQRGFGAGGGDRHRQGGGAPAAAAGQQAAQRLGLARDVRRAHRPAAAGGALGPQRGQHVGHAGPAGGVGLGAGAQRQRQAHQWQAGARRHHHRQPVGQGVLVQRRQLQRARRLWQRRFIHPRGGAGAGGGQAGRQTGQQAGRQGEASGQHTTAVGAAGGVVRHAAGPWL
jgi:hypothetical protein